MSGTPERQPPGARRRTAAPAAPPRGLAGGRGRAGLTLVELLVVIAIGSVVTGALLLTWFSLGQSYSMTTTSTQSREFARDAVARLARELRDAEPSGTYSALRSAGSDEIVFATTFNDPTNEQANSEPVLTRYWYDWDEEAGTGVLYRQRDSRTSGRIGDLFSLDGKTPDPFDRQMVIVRNVLNEPDETTDRAVIFTYSYIGSDGPVKETPPPDAIALPTIFMVHISLSIDLNPQSAPSPMDLTTSVQLRNQGRY